jgi:molecular chaperone HtpG
MEDEKETYAFSADISQLMSLIINAFYSNKEIFLRELVSNASDAMDKICFKGTECPEKLAVNPNMYVNISTDRENNTITIEDAGIGMTRDDLVNNLGTIAKSGTKAFMEYCSTGCDMTMIGQFGVGFYSAYLVADKVRVVSKHSDDEQYIWESSAAGTFIVWKDETFEHGVLKRGTKVICYLKEDMQQEFLETDRLKDLILKHSAFVGYPISINMESRREEDVEGSEDKVVTTTHKWELINKNKPVWLRPREEVTQEEYAELYKWLAGDWEDPIGVKHIIQTGQVEYKALIYCPKLPPKDMFDMGKMSQRFSIRLYVRRVFIKEFNDLIPKWMGFVKGIVDSDDMPLNISREQLQQNAILSHIKNGLQKSIFQMFEEMAKDKKTYHQFYDSFSQCLKLGVYEDSANRSEIIPLLRYHSSKSGEGIVSLDEYIERMKPGQSHILYITGRTLRDAAKSPYIESLKKDGYEVLYMVDPVDEYAIQFMKEYKGKDLLSCMNAHAVSLLGFSRSKNDLIAEFAPLKRRLQSILSEKVTTVDFVDTFEPDVCARIRDGDTMELNFKHGFLKELLKHSEANDDLQDLARLLYQVALLDGADVGDTRREEACQNCQSLINVLNAGEQDDSRADLPALGPVNGKSSGDDAQNKFVTKASAKQSSLISCGNLVRVVKQDRSRRANISFVDEDAGTVDVMYSGSKEEDEEGVPIKAVQALLPFELGQGAAEQDFKSTFYKTANSVKDEGNQLYKLKDFEAASERYSQIICAYMSQPRAGRQVLVVSEENGKAFLKSVGVLNCDAEGMCELSNGMEVQTYATLPVDDKGGLPLQTAAYMNRARCRQSLGEHCEAAQDLSVVLGLWNAADKGMLEADPEMKKDEVKGLYTAQYLRAKSRLARGFVKQASADVRDALARNPPPATVKQLRELKAQVQAAMEEHKRVNGPLARELAKVSISLRGMPKIS